MLTYQIRQRIFKFDTGADISLPADVKVRFHLKPLQPFGMEAGGGHTCVRAVAASVLFNANTGEHTIQSAIPLEPLDVTIKEPIRKITLKGNVLCIEQHFDNLKTLHDTIQSLYFALPMLFNIEFADTPFVERVDGVSGEANFRWELSNWRTEFFTTTQDNQESAIVRSWERMDILADTGRRRLLAALHYFHVACRLARCGSIPGEFLAEVLLNLAKTLEVLFPPTGDGRTRDAVRTGLKKLGYTNDEIEANYIPAMALRNEIDVGHVDLSIFKTEQLKTLHAYVERAEIAFRDFLKRIIDKVASGEFQIDHYELRQPSSQAVKLIERLRQRVQK